MSDVLSTRSKAKRFCERAAACYATAALGLAAIAQPATEPRTDLWVPDGYVRQVVEAGERLYLSGEFSNLVSGFNHGAVYDLASGDRVAQLPEVVGRVGVVVADGHEGWFIGGDFASVDGLPRGNLARLDRNGRLDTAWRAETDGAVWALAIHEETLFVGGEFRSVRGQTRTNMAAVRVDTGDVLEWKRKADSPGPVSLIFVSGDAVIVGGPSLASYDLVTGSENGWKPQIEGHPVTVCSDGKAIFVGGYFRSVEGKKGKGMAAWDIETGELLPWNARAEINPYGVSSTGIGVHHLWTDGRVVVAVGNFKYMAGEPREGFGLIDPESGKPLDWRPAVQSPPQVGQFAGGKFYMVAGRSLHEVDFSERRTRRLVEALPPGARGLAVSGSRLCLIGWFPNAGGVAAPTLAAIDLKTGRPADWHPNLDGVRRDPRSTPTLILATGRRLLTEWIAVPGLDARRIAAFDLERSGPPVWVRDVVGLRIPFLERFNERVLMSVCFREGNADLYSLGPADGSLVLWGPKFGRGRLRANVNGAAVLATRVYVQGEFEQVGGMSVTNLAALDAATGKPVDWRLPVDGWITRLAACNGRLFLGGTFKHVGGEARPGLAALDGATGELTPWNPDIQPEALHNMRTGLGRSLNWLTGQGNVLFATTRSDRGFEPLAERVFAFEATSGARLPWNPRFSGQGMWMGSWTIAHPGASHLYLLSDFEVAGGHSCHGFAAFPWPKAQENSAR